jgi:hypothetical protein
LLEVATRDCGEGVDILGMQEVIQEMRIARQFIGGVAEQFQQARRAPGAAPGLQLPQTILSTFDRTLEAQLCQIERVLGQLLCVNVLHRSGHGDGAAVGVASRRAAMSIPAIFAVSSAHARIHAEGRVVQEFEREACGFRVRLRR